jgi:2',3'-cyclic-nucleotide 2'-phosphodiesterase
MTGDYDSIIGMEKEEPIRRFTQKTPGTRMEPAGGVATLCGIAVETDALGLAAKIAPVRIGGRLSAARPDFWE